MASFLNQHAVADFASRLRPQQVSNGLFFGPLYSLSQHEYLVANNIRFLISVNLATVRVAQYFEALPNKEAFVWVNFDANFKEDATSAAYVAHNSTALSQLVRNLTQAPDTRGFGFTSQLVVTPQPDISSLLYNDLSMYTHNIIAATGTTKFSAFNDLLTLFKASGAGNVLVLSSDGNDAEMCALVASHLVKDNASISMQGAVNYLISLRPTLSEPADANALLQFEQHLRSTDAFTPRDSTCVAPKRRTSSASSSSTPTSLMGNSKKQAVRTAPQD
ncbi:LAMI_0F05864g1_1 [Lachancea mirantina]|uniref:LAMI_0F05864g1_1 n=1 Tax=Lachancea mirantina TaxID=1230905 RepID=A0A1G4JYU2_9SACH|nr:LAMI_0F05864g1_1 [Lachancea mirantina]